mmetsp:Transcript_12700/g.32437  ORF Transcript_12700/g.32437 Transcript_12700/m.32437 type:complete len:620 (-) Transcript_12700:214-2073(-)
MPCPTSRHPYRALLLCNYFAAAVLGVPISSALVPAVESDSAYVHVLREEIARLKQTLGQRADAPSAGSAAVVRLDRAANASVVLNRARLSALGGEKGQVILTFVNKARLDFAATWVAHVRRLGLTNWLVGATDADALAHLVNTGVPCFDLHTSLPEGDWAWGSPSFHQLGPTKVRLIQQVLQWKLELVMTDVDALVLREPFAFMDRYPDASYLTTSDHLSNTTVDETGLERNAGSAYNIGFFFFRASALPLVDEWMRVVTENPTGTWDQGVFNDLARKGPMWVDRSRLSDDRLFPSYNGKVIGGVLPLALFCGGHSYFVAQMPQRLGVQPYSVHTTFQYGGPKGKRWRLREAMLWEDDIDYYDPPGGLLRYDPDVPESLIRPRGGMHAKDHIALVEHQLAQIGSALALARALQRKLILPTIVCGMDKAWFALDSRGVFAGAPSWELPIFNCPLDHVLEPHMLGPERTVREYSLLSNLRTPTSVLNSQASTALKLGSTRVANGELRRLATEFAGIKVLTISNLADALITTGKDLYDLGVLNDHVKQQLELEGLHSVGGSWCCKPQRDPGPNNHGFRLPLLPGMAPSMLKADARRAAGHHSEAGRTDGTSKRPWLLGWLGG